MNMKNRQNMNRARSRHGHKYGKYKKCVSVIMLICIKQHLSNIWNSIHKNVQQHWSWVNQKHVFQMQKVQTNV